jgi:hypothetical protein
VERRADEGGQPRAVDERQREQLDEDGDVVRVAHPAVRTSRDDSELERARDRVDHLDVPVLAHRGDHPPAQHVGEEEGHERGQAQQERERPAQQHDLERAATSTPVCSATMNTNPGSGARRAPRSARARWWRRESRISMRRPAPTAPSKER